MPLVNGIPSDSGVWLRLEPRSRSDDIARGLEARTADPLWMLARQWQTGEFLGEDAGSPLQVHLEYSTQSIDRVRLGESGEAFDLAGEPLEMVVERERPALDWRRRVQAGQQFERFARAMLEEDAPALIDAYRKAYALDLPSGDEWTEIDLATRRFLQFMTGRVIDGQKLLQAVEQHRLVPRPGVVTDLRPLIVRFTDWCQRLNIGLQPSYSGAWRSQQLDYRFELNPSQETQPAGTNLVAPDYRNGDLDWYAFDTAGGLQPDWIPQETIKTHPTRIAVGGTSPRWWAFEDAATDFGRLDVARTDLAKLVLMEFVLIHGDDWFSVPLSVPMPNLVKIDALKVYNVFGEVLGEEEPIPPARKPDLDPYLRWEIFTLSPLPDPSQPGVGDPNLPGVGVGVPGEPDVVDVLFVPPVAGFRQESPPLEEIQFLRDEGANMVWAVEGTVRDGLGRPVRGFDAQRERIERRREADIARLTAELAEIEGQLATGDLSDARREDLEAQAQRVREELGRLREGPRLSASGAPRYRLATLVPENWIPFIPTDARAMLGRPGIRLRRAQMLRNREDEEPSPIPARSQLLELEDDPLLWLEEATVPRAGLRMQLTAQRVRWVDGKTYVWLGRKVLTGQGEGSSGLSFDVL